MIRKTIFYQILMILCSCAGTSSLSDLSGDKKPLVDEHWQLKIINTDASNYPEIRLKGIVLDSMDQVVKNLAPPYGHIEDWQQIWVPLVQEHPKWGEKEFHDLQVRETQFQGVDTTRLLALKREKKELELKIDQGRKAYEDVIIRINVRKSQLPKSILQSAKNTSVVLVMDISGSMSGEPLSKAKLAAAELLEFSDAEIAIIAFDDYVYEKTSFTRDKNRLVSAILSLHSGGGTHLYDALYHAIQMLKNRTGEKHIVALTDGQTHGDLYSLQEIIRFANSKDVSITAQTGEQIKLFTIGLGYEGANLKQLANQTGGKYYFAKHPEQIIEIFSDYIGFKLEQTRPSSDLMSRLHSVNQEIDKIFANVIKKFYYDISFTSLFPTKDGSGLKVGFKFGDKKIWHTIKIPVSAKELVARGYVVDAESRAKIPDAKVIINPQGLGLTFEARTDSTGYFESKVIRTNNKYSIFAEAKNYFISAKEYRLAKPDSYYVTVTLQLQKASKGVKAVMRTIHFENNEFLFEPVSIPDLVSMGEYLVQHPEFRFQVAGHTDSYGRAPYNQWLSERRAEAVAEFFISLGVPEDNIVITGFGESRLLLPDTNEENRYMNRRVEIKLLEKDRRKIVGK